MPNLSGGKWGGGNLGSSGGVVTWSLVGQGQEGVISAFGTSGSFFRGHDQTVNGQGATGFNVVSTLQRAFDAWSDVADIEFVQVADGGERLIGGYSADIRIAFGYIDGTSLFGSQLGAAYFATRTETARSGDILFDKDEFRSSSSQRKFLGVATHEIGHSIGLRHVDNEAALLNPTVGDHVTPQADDIKGARQIYGEPRSAIKSLALDENTPDIRIMERADGLRIKGTGEENRITGAAGGEEMRGLGGDDSLLGAGGADSLYGGAGDDFQKGGGGQDRLLGNGGGDTLIGGGRSDFLKGGGGNDLLKGGGGADELFGNGRDDTLDGGRGDDTLKGGGGADVFVLSGGRDLVLDFDTEMDRIDASGFAGIVDLSISDAEAGAEVSAGAKTLVLRGVGADELSEDQFIFANDLTPPATSPTAPEPEPEPEKTFKRVELTNSSDLYDPFGADPDSVLEPVEVFALDGDDDIIGTGKGDIIFGGDGNDFVVGVGKGALVFVGDGADTLFACGEVFGEAGDDSIDGGGSLFGGLGADTVEGGNDDDTIDGGQGVDRLDGGDGNDLIFFTTEDALVLGGDGDDLLELVARNERTKDNIEIVPGAGADVIKITVDIFPVIISVTGFDAGLDQIDLSELSGFAGPESLEFSEELFSNIVSIIGMNIVLDFDNDAPGPSLSDFIF